MRLAAMPRSVLARVLAWLLLPLAAHAYWQVTFPNATTQWVNGQTNEVRWTKGLLDGIASFDLELARLSSDGLIFLARDVPTGKNSGLSVVLQDVPPADDYFLLFLNSTHGLTYVVSDRFSILAAGTQPSSGAATSAPPLTSAPATITVSGGPNPTAQFVTTFPPSAASKRALVAPASVLAAVLALGAGALAGVWTVW